MTACIVLRVKSCGALFGFSQGRVGGVGDVFVVVVVRYGFVGL